MTPEEQFEQIARGAVEIYSQKDLMAKLRTGKPLTVKLGVDATAPQLHVGHAVAFRKLRLFQNLGHNAVLLIGDYTAMVGDPSDQDKTRPSLSLETIRNNAKRYVEQAALVLDRSKLKVVYNGEWFEKMPFQEVIRLASRITVAQMLERDSFSKRYKAGAPIHLHEFLYPMMQAYDSVMLEADVELGATEQTFNLLAGREMQRDFGQEPQVCITHPMLVGLDGTRKMSKSLGNFIAMEDPPVEMFGKAMSIPDALMRDYFTLLTDLPAAEIDRNVSDAMHPRDAKALLARLLTAQYHGEEKAQEASGQFDKVFRDKSLPDEIAEFAVPAEECEGGSIGILRLVTLCGFAKSNRAARSLVEQGGVRLDEVRIEDPTSRVAVKDGAVLRVGKRHFARLRT